MHNGKLKEDALVCYEEMLQRHPLEPLNKIIKRVTEEHRLPVLIKIAEALWTRR